MRYEYPPIEREALVQLEQLIDKHGAANFLRGIAEICEEKAKHVSTNFGDEDPLVHIWNELQSEVEFAANTADDLP